MSNVRIVHTTRLKSADMIATESGRYHVFSGCQEAASQATVLEPPFAIGLGPPRQQGIKLPNDWLEYAQQCFKCSMQPNSSICRGIIRRIRKSAVARSVTKFHARGDGSGSDTT